MSKRPATALAIAAHPDDIEFVMAGTLLLLQATGFEIHYLNLASGSCGSAELGPAATRSVRRRESRQAARILGAIHHPSLVDDLEILYEINTLRRLTAIVRDVRPTIVLTHSPEDYMEDHMNACRLAVTATFARGMRNFRAIPQRPVENYPATLYHAMPHGLCDGLGQQINPGLFVNTESVHLRKREALAAHESQKAWLDVSQGMDSYLTAMDEMSLAVGKMSRRFRHAEGWRQHSHLGFCGPTDEPLGKALGSLCFRNGARRRRRD